MGRRHPAGPDRGDRRHSRRPAGARRRGPRNRARRARARPRARPCPGCCCRPSARSGSTPRRPGSGPRGGGSRSPTSSATGGFIETPSAASSAARDRSSPSSRRPARRSRRPRTRRTCSPPRVLMPARLVQEQYVRLRAGLLPPVRYVRRVRRCDGAPTSRGDQARDAFPLKPSPIRRSSSAAVGCATDLSDNAAHTRTRLISHWIHVAEGESAAEQRAAAWGQRLRCECCSSGARARRSQDRVVASDISIKLDTAVGRCTADLPRAKWSHRDDVR